MKKEIVFCLALGLSAALAVGTAAGAGEAAMHHVQLAPNELHWMAAPPVLPPGAKLAVLMGNPFHEGLFAVRLKLPAHYTIPPHWHPTAESFTIIKGELRVGMGDTVDKSKAKSVPVGGFVSLPALGHHYVYTGDDETIIDLFAYGPFQLYYVNPADDPAKQSRTKR